MIKRTIVIRKNSWLQQTNKKRNTLPIVALKSHTAGFVNPMLVVFVCTAFAGLFYIYSVNQTAIKGIAIRDAEKLVAEKGKFNESLKIKEAELKSLYRIEDASKQLNMIDATNVQYLEDGITVAFREGKK
jgi:hypothetical protein